MEENTQLPKEVINDARKVNTHKTFLNRIKVSSSGCWEWQGSKDARGYGKISINGTYWRTNRYSYKYYKGDVDGFDVLHKCDNPACCNPDHLFIGNPSENAIDMIKKSRSKVPKTTPEQVVEIRRLFDSGKARKEIAECVGVSRRVVESIINKERWNHLTGDNIDDYKH